MKIRKAIVPAAGIGSRMFPLSRFIPKELLPFGKPLAPLIALIMHELSDSGISEVGIVTRQEKRDVLEVAKSRKRGKIKIVSIEQKKPSGLVDALWMCRDFLEGEPFLLVFPDQHLTGAFPASYQLLKAAESEGVWSTAVRVRKEERRFFPGASGLRTHGTKPVFISEKETRVLYSKRNYEWRAFGRTIVPFEVFRFLASFRGKDSVGFTQAFTRMTETVPHFLVRLIGRACDLGTLQGYGNYLNKAIRDDL